MIWPFSRRAARPTRISPDFAVNGQIRVEDIPVLAAEGYRSILCVRPDGEAAGQPDFAEIAAVAAEHGLKAFHIPVSGGATARQEEAFRSFMKDADTPVLAYCRSGGRARALHARLKR